MRPDSRLTTRTKLNPRKADTGKNKKHRGILIAATSLAVAGLVIGGGVASQSAMAAQEKVQATAAAANHADATAKTKQDATATLDSANQVLAAAQGKVDTTTLTASVASLADYKAVTLNVTAARIADTTAQTTAVQTATADADRVAADAEAQRVAAAAATAAQATAAIATDASNSPAGAQATARDMGASRYGWDDSEMSCLTQLWDKESGWSYTATNASSGATGIPQALPGSKMASAGGDWATNASTQVSWGLDYVQSRFGTPCAAWAHSESVGWY